MSPSRRTFLRTAALSPFIACGSWSCRSRGDLRAEALGRAIRIEEVSHTYQDFLYRTPIKFGGRALDRVTIIDVTCVVSCGGRTAKGFGSMPLGNVWSFPSKTMSYDVTLGAMKALAERIEKITAGYKESGHPVELNRSLEPAYLAAASQVSIEQKLDQPIPKLCAVVTISPFDAAIHDAYGKLHGRNSFLTGGPEFLEHDLSRYLTPDFAGQYLDRYVLPRPRPTMPLYHLVGALDPIFPSDVKSPVGDGLPETLPEWILRDGLTHFKIKLNGEDLGWDIERVVNVERAAVEAEARRGVGEWVHSLDFNERCRNVAYLIEFLNRLREKSPRAYDRIQYIEQPTARDLKADRANVMHQAAKLKPVVIDESLTDLESLLLAEEMGYTGVALKACKGQSQALLMAAAAQKHRMFLCVQDLTCPGASLVHSAGLAAHIPGVQAIEANARQYCPAANIPWEKKFPGLFVVKDGQLETGDLDRPGLSAVPA
jgi:L-alanine-DL-glutamate epimerase-like enolase superfamily enzyme